MLLWAAAAPRARVRLHASTYGMQAFEVERALEAVRGLGYDGVELCLMAGWPSEPAQLDASARGRLRGAAFPIPTLIENGNTLVSDADHARMQDRIRAAAALAHDVAPASPPLLQTVLGGKPDEWEQVKEKMAARLSDWARVAAENRLRLAVKSHIGSASNTPEKLLWLLDRVRNPALSAIYDYSHFQLLGLKLKPTLEALLPRSSFVTVKDGRLENGAPRFLLPGEGTIDYGTYFRLLKQRRFDGWMLVEVSRQLQTQPGYDAVDAARRSYTQLAPLLKRAGLR
ncbi:MAG: sugar phosphate isomerase/epimerase [Bryobacterales bacterium]|nr:sugar phosphate isomerase/epimerase [Bryobacterales bacterium]